MLKRLALMLVTLSLVTLGGCQTAPDDRDERPEIKLNPVLLQAFRDDPGIAQFRHSGPIDVRWYDEAVAAAHRTYAAAGRGAEMPEILVEAERQLRRAVNYPLRFGATGNRLWVEPRGADVDMRLVARALAGSGLFTEVQAGHLLYH